MVQQSLNDLIGKFLLVEIQEHFGEAGLLGSTPRIYEVTRDGSYKLIREFRFTDRYEEGCAPLSDVLDLDILRSINGGQFYTPIRRSDFWFFSPLSRVFPVNSDAEECCIGLEDSTIGYLKERGIGITVFNH